MNVSRLFPAANCEKYKLLSKAWRVEDHSQKPGMQKSWYVPL